MTLRRAALVAWAIGLVVRLLVVAGGRDLPPDGAIDLDIARALVEGRWRDAVLLRFHPLLGALVAVVSTLAGRAPDEPAAVLVVVLVSSLVPPLVVLLASRFTDRAYPALVAGLLAAAHPYLARAGATVYAYPLSHAAIAAAVLALTHALATGRLRWTFASGVTAGLGYLARPDGLVLAAAVWGATLAAGVPARSRRARAAPALLLLLGFAIPAAPYLLAIHDATGTWRLTLKKDERHLAGAAATTTPPAPDGLLLELARAEQVGLSAPPAPRPTTYPGALASSLAHALDAGHPLVVALAALGLVATRRGRALHAPALAVLGAFLLAHAQLKLQTGYLARNHATATAALLCAWAGPGVALVAARRLRRVAPALCVALLLAKAVAPKTAVKDRLARAVAAHLAERGHAVVMGRDARPVAWLAGARYVPVPPGDAAAVVAAARREGATCLLLLVRTHAPVDRPWERSLLQQGLGPPARFEDERRDAEGGVIHYTWLAYELSQGG